MPTTDVRATICARLAAQRFKLTGEIASDRECYRVYCVALPKTEVTIRRHVKKAGLMLHGYGHDVRGIYLKVSEEV